MCGEYFQWVVELAMVGRKLMGNRAYRDCKQAWVCDAVQRIEFDED